MVRLKSRTQCPVNGFQFIDAPIDPNPMQTWDFNQMVRQVISRREMNPRFGLSVDQRTVEREVDEQNAMRMLSIRNAESYVVVEGQGPPNFQTPRSKSWPSAVGAVKTGVNTLADWLGEGGTPVPKEQSEARAFTCATCPQNGQGDWLSVFTKPAQLLIQGQMNLRNDLSMSTSSDDKLGICNACKCPLKLKVHVPINHISANMPAEIRAGLDPRCWIILEIEQRT